MVLSRSPSRGAISNDEGPMTTIEKVLADYENGAITKRERLVALARLITPETIEAVFASIPQGIVEELLAWTRAAPLEGGLMIGGELSTAAADKFAQQQYVAVCAIRDWGR